MFEVGRACVKIAGRDARKKCVVVDVLDNRFVLIDGETRRRKCNIAHLEPLNMIIEIPSGADNEAVVSALKQEGIVCDIKKESKKQPQQRPKKEKAKKQKPVKEKKAVKEEKKIEQKKSETEVSEKPKKETVNEG